MCHRPACFWQKWRCRASHTHKQPGVRCCLPSACLQSICHHESSPQLLHRPALCCKSAHFMQASSARTDPRGAPVLAGQRAGGSVTVMHRPARKGKGNPQEDHMRIPNRVVANCLQCGKVFFPTADTAEAKALIGTSTTKIDCSSSGSLDAAAWCLYAWMLY